MLGVIQEQRPLALAFSCRGATLLVMGWGEHKGLWIVHERQRDSDWRPSGR